VKKAVLLSALGAMYLYGANTNLQDVINEVANLRQKYEECRQTQNNSVSASESAAKIKGYQTRIGNLENQIKQTNSELQSLKKLNTDIERELSQKRGVVQSLERSLTLKDQQLRDASALNERLGKEANAIKVGKIERESLKSALVKAKMDAEQLEKSMGKTDKEVVALRASLASAKAEIEKLRSKPTQSTPPVPTPVVNTNPDQSNKIKALQNELAKANATIIQLQNTPKTTSSVHEKVVTVTKVVEPTEKIVALQRELSAAQATIAKLKNTTGAKTVIKEKIVEKVVYKDRLIPQEKVVEKIVYKDRPVIQEKIVEKVVYKDRPVAAVAEKVTPKTAVESKTPLTAAEPVKKSAPCVYRMASDAPIYSAPGGHVVDTWEARRSFTSGTAANGWVKITGYFVNRVWTRADQELWVKESDVIKR
jgi:predicted  nucleic acid-binding Zn-ribbon protein